MNSAKWIWCGHQAETNVFGVRVPAGERISLSWASANRDVSAFPRADEVVLDRKPNPHVAFGSGVHNCLGAWHARLTIRMLLRQLVKKVKAIRALACAQRFEVEKDYTRRSG
jgi:cytochrome P450